jgi:PAS domain S-box-containing protein
MRKVALIQNFSLTCFIVLVVICVVFGGIITYTLEQNMLTRTERLTANVVSNEVTSEFLVSDFIPPRNDTEYNDFAEIIEHLTFVPGIERIKIWNKDGIVVWSDIKEIIGQRFPDNDDLFEALQGEIVSEISSLTKEEHEFEHHFERLMELYVPIRFKPQGNIEIVFEIYQNLDPLYEDISQEKLIVWISSILGFTILYIMLFGLVWRASKLIDRQTEEIVATEVVRKSEARLSNIFNATPDSVVICRLRDGQLMYINPAFTSMLEFTPEETLGKTVDELNIWANQKDWESLIKTLEEEGEVRGFEADLRTKEEHIFPGYMSASVIEMEGEKCMVLVARDITKRKQIEEEIRVKTDVLEKLTTDLRDLSNQLSMQEEQSRKRFARILHEQIGQDLATIKLSFKNILERSPLDEEKTKNTINDVISILSDTMMSTRELTADLYPAILDDLGFIPAVKWHTEKIMNPNGINISLDINEQVENLPTTIKLSLFRVIQESFQNIVKHASATKAYVELTNSGGILKLSVKDNGCGFDTEIIKEKTDKGIGLRLIKERALSIGADFKLDSTLEMGTEIILEVPAQT